MFAFGPSEKILSSRKCSLKVSRPWPLVSPAACSTCRNSHPVVGQIVVTEYGADPYHGVGACGEREACKWSLREVHDDDYSREEGLGRMLAEALDTAEHGTTIEIAASCSCPAIDFNAHTSVRLIGNDGGEMRTWKNPLVVRWQSPFIAGLGSRQRSELWPSRGGGCDALPNLQNRGQICRNDLMSLALVQGTPSCSINELSQHLPLRVLPLLRVINSGPSIVRNVGLAPNRFSLWARPRASHQKFCLALLPAVSKRTRKEPCVNTSTYVVAPVGTKAHAYVRRCENNSCFLKGRELSVVANGASPRQRGVHCVVAARFAYRPESQTVKKTNNVRSVRGVQD